MARVYDVELDVRYISVRMLLWIAAAGAQWVWIGLKSSVVSHTAPLSKVIAAATSVFALRDVFVTIFITAPSMPLLYWTTLLRSVTDGVFVFAMLLTSAGYCIIIRNIREVPKLVFALPIVYTIANTTMYWITFALDTDGTYQADPENPGEKEQEEILVLLISALLQAFLYIMAAVYVVDGAEYVAKRLEAAAPRAPAAEEADEVAMQAAMEARPDGFAAVEGAPEITTVAEEADRLGNARLMRRFKNVVMAYIIGRVLSVFLPAFGTDDPTSTTAAAVIAGTVLWYLMRYLLMLALAWVFRIREQDTMYLPIGADEETATQLDTHIEMEGLSMARAAKASAASNGGASAPAPGLGTALQRTYSAQSPARRAPSAASPRQEGKFTLDEDEKLD